jgi:hypothetical protein
MNSAVRVISAGVITACFGAVSLPGFFLCAPASGMPMATSSSATRIAIAPDAISAPTPPDTVTSAATIAGVTAPPR